MSLAVIGIDPGLDGGIAVLAPEQASPLIYLAPMPARVVIKTKRELDLAALKKFVIAVRSQHDQVVLMLEKQQSMPRDSNQSAFTTGKNYGVLLATFALYNIQIDYVGPQEWQKVRFEGLPKEADTKSKSILVFERTFPNVSLLVGRATNKHNGMADAANIACYGHHKILIGKTVVSQHG